MVSDKIVLPTVSRYGSFNFSDWGRRHVLKHPKLEAYFRSIGIKVRLPATPARIIREDVEAITDTCFDKYLQDEIVSMVNYLVNVEDVIREDEHKLLEASTTHGGLKRYAKQEGITLSAARKRLQRARKRLQLIFSKHR